MTPSANARRASLLNCDREVMWRRYQRKRRPLCPETPALWHAWNAGLAPPKASEYPPRNGPIT